MRMTWGANILDFFYDESGLPYAMKYNGTAYYYITNLQGDVMRIVDGSQNTVTSYDYDPYGKVISAMGTLANINPLRYRGYVYDTETGFYYLQSRYYDPTVGRFINADSYATTGQGIIGHNMFAYCLNNPAGFVDNGGQLAVTAGTLIVVTASKVIELALLTSGLALVGCLGYTIGKTSTAASLFPEEEIKEQIEHSLATGESTTYRKETERHHIVARRAAKAAPAARILNEVLKDGVESELNLVDLSTKVHRRLHTNLYYNFVNLAIVGAYNAVNGDPAQQERNVRNTLGAIKVMLQAIDAVFS